VPHSLTVDRAVDEEAFVNVVRAHLVNDERMVGAREQLHDIAARNDDTESLVIDWARRWALDAPCIIDWATAAIRAHRDRRVDLLSRAASFEFDFSRAESRLRASNRWHYDGIPEGALSVAGSPNGWRFPTD
jgi:hypothetical protein